RLVYHRLTPKRLRGSVFVGRVALRVPASPLSRTNPRRAARKAFWILGLYYLLAALAVRLTRERWWGVLPDLLAWSLTCRRHARQQVFSQRACSILEGGAEDAAFGRLERRNEAAAQQRVVFVAASRRGRGWNPAVALQGRDQLAKALREGKGAILWSDPFA